MKKCDIVIPLSSESVFDNLELRFALRSSEKYVQNIGDIYIITDSPPHWIKNAKIIYCKDNHSENKDANLIDKLALAASMDEVSEQFIFLSDDQAFLAPFDCENSKVVYNKRGMSFFANQNNKWRKRMFATFEFLKKRGITLEYNFDSHTPKVYNKKDFLLLEGIDYVTPPGFCINTLLGGLLGLVGEVDQVEVKAHAEKLGQEPNFDGKLFAGYNDTGFYYMKKELEKIFYYKSKYEK